MVPSLLPCCPVLQLLPQPGIQKSISFAGRLSRLLLTCSQGTNTQGDRPRLKLVLLPCPSGPSSGSAEQAANGQMDDQAEQEMRHVLPQRTLNDVRTTLTP